MAGPEVSIIIVNHNTAPYLRRCLATVIDAAAPYPTEIVVVDNASADGSCALVRAEFPRCHLVESHENRGFANAVNRALAITSAPMVLLLNPDTELSPDALSVLVGTLRDRPRVAAVGCRLLHADGSLQPSAFRFPTMLFECAGILGLDAMLPLDRIRRHRWLGKILPASGHFDDHASAREVDFALAACLLVRREALVATGGLDERYFLYYEDIDLGRSLQSAGWTSWFTPEATILHHESVAARQNLRTAFRERHRSRLLYFSKHHGRGTRAAIRVTMAMSVGTQLLVLPVRRLLARRSRSRTDGKVAVSLPDVADYIAVLRYCWPSTLSA